MKIFLWLLKCGQPGTKGRDPKGNPGQVAWRVAAVAIWISVRKIVTNDIQLQLSAHFGAFSNLLLLRPCFMALHGVWSPWETGSLLGKMPVFASPDFQTAGKSKGCLFQSCFLRQSQSTGRLIYPKLKGLSTFEWNISVLLSPSCSFLFSGEGFCIGSEEDGRSRLTEQLGGSSAAVQCEWEGMGEKGGRELMIFRSSGLRKLNCPKEKDQGSKYSKIFFQIVAFLIFCP